MANGFISKIADLFGLIGQADTLLENSWRNGQWGSFVRAWLVSAVAVTVIGFLLPFVFFMLPALAYDFVALFMKTRTIPVSFPETVSFGLKFGGMVGAAFLVTTIPMMMFKQYCRDWEMVE